MNPGFAVIAAVLAGLGLICLWFWRKYRREIALMSATETSRAAEVASLAPGTLVEVKGAIRCASPLTGAFSGQPCIYSRNEIQRKETRWRDGKSETRYVTESSNEYRVPFEVEDASGRVQVNPDGASVEAMEVYNQSRASTTETLVSLAASLAGAGSFDRRYREHLLAPDIPVYVLGWVQPGGAIGAAPAGASSKEFLITYQSEEARSRSSRTTTIILIVVSVLCFAGAAASLYAAFKY